MEKYYNVKDVCRITGFKRVSIIQHIRAGHLKFYKPVGSHEYRFTEKQIEEFMTSGSPAGR